MLILSYKASLRLGFIPVELLITTVMASSILFSTPLPEPTYPVNESVNTITATTTEVVATTTTTIAEPVTLTNTAGTSPKVSVVGKPRLVALEGESQEVIDAIISHFPEAPIMVEVARCESRMNPSADRKGIDGGLFQINQVHLPELTRLGLNRYDLEDNLAYSRILYNQGGLTPWNMSRYCWGKYA